MLYFFLTSLFFACSAEAITQKGQKALDAHDLAGAETHFRKAISKDNRHLPAVVGLGWTYLLAGEKEGAEKVFDRCLQISAQDPGCLRGRASVSMRSGAFAKAQELLNKAMELYPDNPKVLSSYALLLLNQGNLGKAEEHYRSLVERLPRQAEYRLGLAESRLRQGDSDSALALVESAIAIKSTPVRTVAMLWALRARSLIARSAGLEDSDNCDQTAPPVLAWIKSAEKSADRAFQTGVELPDLPALRRQILRRRAVVKELCPATTAATSDDN